MPNPAPSPGVLTLTRPDDWHLHLRDGAGMARVLPATADVFGRAIIMPNLRPPVTTTAAAAAYRTRIVNALRTGSRFEPLMTLYLTDNTSAEEIATAKASGFVHAVKYYPAGATTNSDAGVTRIERAYPAFAAMEKHDVVLSVHGEVVDVGGIKIVGYTNVAGRVAQSASSLYARNLFNFIETMVDKPNKALAVNWDDELVKATALTRDGAVIHPNFQPKT